MRVVPVTSSSDRQTVTAVAATFDTTMADGQFWVVTTSVAAYIKQGSAPTATAGDASVLLGAGQSCMLYGNNGAKLSIIRATADGEATLTRAEIL